jgi:hypothetical protein
MFYKLCCLYYPFFVTAIMDWLKSLFRKPHKGHYKQLKGDDSNKKQKELDAVSRSNAKCNAFIAPSDNPLDSEFRYFFATVLGLSGRTEADVELIAVFETDRCLGITMVQSRIRLLAGWREFFIELYPEIQKKVAIGYHSYLEFRRDYPTADSLMIPTPGERKSPGVDSSSVCIIDALLNDMSHILTRPVILNERAFSSTCKLIVLRLFLEYSCCDGIFNAAEKANDFLRTMNYLNQ